MPLLPPHIKEWFYHTLTGDISLSGFEQWLYSEEELENILTPDDYLALISLNFKKSGAKYNLWNLLKKQIDLGDFETDKLLKLLKDAQHKTERRPFILIAFYNLYCKGYYFLDNLGLGYGLAVEAALMHNVAAESWDELNAQEKQQLLNLFSPKLEEEIDKVIGWLQNKSVVLTGEQDEFGNYGYNDYRSSAERKP
jgi:hypothetical protein